jgi:hypothetical protein
MSQNWSKKNFSSERSDLIFETVILARQLKALSDANLHRRRVKSTSRETLEIVCLLYSDITSKSIFEKTKDKIRSSRELEDNQEQFSSNWVIDLSLITTAVKTFFVEIKQFRDYLAENLEFVFTSQSSDLSIFVFTQKETSDILILSHREFFDDSVDLIKLSTLSNIAEQEEIHSHTRNISSKHSEKFGEIEKFDKDSDSDESREVSTTNSIDDLERDKSSLIHRRRQHTFNQPSKSYAFNRTVTSYAYSYDERIILFNLFIWGI